MTADEKGKAKGRAGQGGEQKAVIEGRSPQACCCLKSAKSKVRALDPISLYMLTWTLSLSRSPYLELSRSHRRGVEGTPLVESRHERGDIERAQKLGDRETGHPIAAVRQHTPSPEAVICQPEARCKP